MYGAFEHISESYKKYKSNKQNNFKEITDATAHHSTELQSYEQKTGQK